MKIAKIKKKRRIRLIIMVASAIVLFGIGSFFSGNSAVLFPFIDRELPYYSFTDRSDQGNSVVHEMSQHDSTIHFSYTLHSGFAYPYCGAGLEIAKRDGDNQIQYFDLSPYDSLILEVRSTASQMLRWQFVNFDPNLTEAGNFTSYRFLVQHFPVERQFKRVALSMDNFRIPAWWFDQNKVKSNMSERHLEGGWHFEVINSNQMPLEIRDTIQIRSIVLKSKNHALPWILFGVWLLLAIVLTTHYLMKGVKTKIRAQSLVEIKKEIALESYEQIPVHSQKSNDSQRLLSFISTNFSDPDLSLETLTRETGLNRNKVAAIIRDEIGESFKSYLNSLRLKEAARHLKESDLQVTEIAFMVGYKNISHFNRLFKDKFGVSPKIWRS